jgi:hypothetical protein
VLFKTKNMKIIKKQRNTDKNQMVEIKEEKKYSRI